MTFPPTYSQGPVSTATGARIDAARNTVLQHFGASPREWSVVFTSGATAALKTVGEQFPWRPRRRGGGRRRRGGMGGSRFVHARRSHNSVLGIREYAGAGGADVECLDLEFGVDGIDTSGGGCCCCCVRPLLDLEAMGGGEEEVEDGRRCGCCCCSRSCREGEGDSRLRLGTGGVISASAGFGDVTAGANNDNERARLGAAIDGRRSGCRGGDRICCSSDSDSDNDDGDPDDGSAADCLFAFPAECNATGLRPNLDIAARVKRGALSARRHRCRRRRFCTLQHCHETVNRESAGSANPPGSTHGQCLRDCQFSAAIVTGRTNGADTGEGDGEQGRDGGSPVAVNGRRRRRKRRRKERWWVLLDAAKFAGTAPLDLSKVEADFVAVSFYKIFG